MARIHGKAGEVKMDTTGAATFVVVADLNAWTLDMATDRVEVTAFQDLNKLRVAGLPDFSGTVGGWWNSATTPTLFDAVLAGTPVTLRLTPNKNEANYSFTGLANLDGSINVSATGAVSISGKWDAAGNWTMQKNITATGATAGSPGFFTPAGATAPTNLAGMTGKTASPGTLWTSGQYVVLMDNSNAYWNGTAWTAGKAP